MDIQIGQGLYEQGLGIALGNKDTGGHGVPCGIETQLGHGLFVVKEQPTTSPTMPFKQLVPWQHWVEYMQTPSPEHQCLRQRRCLIVGVNNAYWRPVPSHQQGCSEANWARTHNKNCTAHAIDPTLPLMIRSAQPDTHATARNVLGGPLLPCSTDPITGFYRTGCCDTGPDDEGSHTVCIVATADFLAFSCSAGNDLTTPHEAFGFAGLRPGDQWCLCAPRWVEALQAGHAPPVVLGATHEGALAYTTLEDLRSFAVES
jgi:uncharacterized protein (DUF2237 family)